MIRFSQLLCAASAMTLAAACGGTNADSSTDIEATDSGSETVSAVAPVWPPTEEEETLYLKRFNTLVEAYASGAATTVYDTLGPVRGAPDESGSIPVSASPLDPDVATSIDAYADANNSQALIVLQNGEIVHEAYFNGADANSLIVGKSLAKPLGVVAVGRAIQTGKIESLDQPVSDFITEWQGTDKERILVRHLLDMRTGLLPQAGAPEPQDVLNRAYLHPRHDQVIINDYPLVGEPGERYDYSNANAELVAPLIERATGIQYEDWVADQILIPLGAAGGEVWMNRPGGTAHAGCCMLLPARSWLKLAHLIMNNGVGDGKQLLPEGFTTEMRTPQPQNSHSGMGLYVGQPYLEYRGFLNPEIEFGKSYHSEPYDDEDLFLFDGNSNQVIYMVPSKDLIVLRLGETPPKEPVWDNAFLPNTVSRAF